MQYPVGYLSDRYDRRTIIGVLIFVSLLACVASPWALGINLWLLLVLIAVSAGVFGSLYAISISQTFDSLKQSEMGAAMGALVMMYALGAIVGPLASSKLMQAVGPDSLFYLLCAQQVLLLSYIVYRMSQREALPVEQQEAYVLQGALGSAGVELDPRTEFNETEQPLSTRADMAVIVALTDPAEGIGLATDVVRANPLELMAISYAMAQIEGVDSKELMRAMSRIVPERRSEIAETIAMAWPEGATDIVTWLLDEGTTDAHEAIAGMAQAVPDRSSEIIEAAIEQFSDSDAEPSVVQDFVESYVETIGDHVDNLRPADRDDDNSSEHLAEVYAVVTEAMPEQSVDLAQTMTEAVPSAASEVTEALVQAVTAEDDQYDRQTSELISLHMSNLADTVPEQMEDIAASIIETMPEAAEDVDEALREWQESESDTSESEEQNRD